MHCPSHISPLSLVDTTLSDQWHQTTKQTCKAFQEKENSWYHSTAEEFATRNQTKTTPVNTLSKDIKILQALDIHLNFLSSVSWREDSCWIKGELDQRLCYNNSCAGKPSPFNTFLSLYFKWFLPHWQPKITIFWSNSLVLVKMLTC